MSETVLLTLSDAAERKGTRRQTILAALNRGELNGVQGATGWAGVRDDGALASYAPAGPGRPKRTTPGRSTAAADAPGSPSKPRTRRKATDAPAAAAEPSDAPTPGATADGSRADG